MKVKQRRRGKEENSFLDIYFRVRSLLKNIWIKNTDEWEHISATQSKDTHFKMSNMRCKVFNLRIGTIIEMIFDKTVQCLSILI